MINDTEEGLKVGEFIILPQIFIVPKYNLTFGMRTLNFMPNLNHSIAC